MLPLGPGLEAAHTALDAELDPLVVARLEVQAVIIGGRAPVTTEQRLPAPEEDRGCNRFAGAHGELDHERLAERTCRFAEERPRQIWLVAVAQKRVAMKGVTLVEHALIELAAQAGFEVDPCLGDPPPLAAGFLALVRREGLEVRIEARIAAVRPMELAVTPHEPTVALASRARRLVQKQCVDRGYPVAGRIRLHVPEQTVGRGGALEIAPHQQPGAGGGRERHRH